MAENILPEALNAHEIAEIENLIQKYVLSIDEANVFLGGEIWANSTVASFVHPRGHEHGWEQIRQRFYVETMAEPFSSRKLTVREPVLSKIAEGTALAVFYWDFIAIVSKDGSTLTTSGRETQVYRREKKGWAIVHVHYSGPAVTGELQGF